MSKSITVDGVEYVPRSDQLTMAVSTDGLDYCIFRGDRSGAFAGFLKKRKGKEVEIVNARRLWYWDGASSLSEVAVNGVSRPENCKFPCEVPSLILTDLVEVIPATEKAQLSINSVSVWTQN